MIVKREDGYHVMSEHGKHLGGPYSKEHAKKRLRQIEYFKHQKHAEEKSELTSNLKKDLKSEHKANADYTEDIHEATEAHNKKLVGVLKEIRNDERDHAKKLKQVLKHGEYMNIKMAEAFDDELQKLAKDDKEKKYPFSRYSTSLWTGGILGGVTGAARGTQVAGVLHKIDPAIGPLNATVPGGAMIGAGVGAAVGLGSMALSRVLQARALRGRQNLKTRGVSKNERYFIHGEKTAGLFDFVSGGAKFLKGIGPVRQAALGGAALGAVGGASMNEKHKLTGAFTGAITGGVLGMVGGKYLSRMKKPLTPRGLLTTGVPSPIIKV